MEPLSFIVFLLFILCAAASSEFPSWIKYCIVLYCILLYHIVSYLIWSYCVVLCRIDWLIRHSQTYLDTRGYTGPLMLPATFLGPCVAQIGCTVLWGCWLREWWSGSTCQWEGRSSCEAPSSILPLLMVNASRCLGCQSMTLSPCPLTDTLL